MVVEQSRRAHAGCQSDDRASGRLRHGFERQRIDNGNIVECNCWRGKELLLQQSGKPGGVRLAGPPRGIGGAERLVQDQAVAPILTRQESVAAAQRHAIGFPNDRHNLERDGKVYHVFNAENMFYGEIIARTSVFLRGKHKPIYSPTKWYLGDTVVIVNADKLTLPGNRMKTHVLRYHTGYPGHLRTHKFRDLVFRKPEYLFFRGVYKVLPKNRLRFRLLENLHVYQGPVAHLHNFLPSVA